MKIRIRRSRGFSVIEIMITFAVTMILVAFTVPQFIDPGIRAKVEVGLGFAGEAQAALIKTCRANETAVINNNLEAGYFYIPSGTDQDYLDRILLGADCAKDSMVIVVWTGHTGAMTDPVLELSASPSAGNTWTCRVIRGDMKHVPDACQKSYQTI